MSSSGPEDGLQDDATVLQTVEKGHKKRRLWTKQEDEKLRLLVSYWGDQGGRQSNWDKIAAQFVDRPSKSCRKRWFHSLDPKLRRGKWNKNEDRVLMEAYEQLGPAWQRIALLIPGRTDDQCSKRYMDVLDPSVQDRLRPWDEEEDKKLQELYKKHNSKWQAIAMELKGRTGLVCRNRWRKLSRPPKEAMPVAADDINGTVRVRQSDPSHFGDNEVAGGLNYEVPGGTAFPAGADVNWFLAAGAGAGTGTNAMEEENKHMFIMVEDPSTEPVRQHPISAAQLDKLIATLANERQIVIHQHTYRNPTPDQRQQPQQLQPQQHTIQTMQPQIQPQIHASPTIQHVKQPSISHHQHHQSLGMYDPMLSRPGNSMRPAPPADRLPLGHGYPHMSAVQSPPTQHLRNPIAQTNRSSPIPGAQFPLPPPDEFLSLPLSFEEPRQPNSFFDLEKDFLAFNPS